MRNSWPSSRPCYPSEPSPRTAVRGLPPYRARLKSDGSNSSTAGPALSGVGAADGRGGAVSPNRGTGTAGAGGSAGFGAGGKAGFGGSSFTSGGGSTGTAGGFWPLFDAANTHASSDRKAGAAPLASAACFIPPCAASAFTNSGLAAGSLLFTCFIAAFRLNRVKDGSLTGPPQAILNAPA